VRECVLVLMCAVPEHIDPVVVTAMLLRIPHVVGVSASVSV
jgi:hypothetical protein